MTIEIPSWYSRVSRPMDEQPDHQHPMRRIDETIAANTFMLNELAEAKARAVFWKRQYVRELMRRADYPALKHDGVPYGAMELDHAQAEAPFWNDAEDKAGNVLMEYQS